MMPRRCLPPLWREFVPIIRAARSVTICPGQRRTPAGGMPVLLIPGLYAGDRSLHPLARALEQSDYDVWNSAISCNVACSESTIELLDARLEHIAEHSGSRVAIVGHSRGGLLGRVLARRRPDLVSGLVMLGAPCQDQLAVHPVLWAQLLGMAVLG
jgi:pimeloyl-ACP methyl ester carboxylesterase